MATPSQREDWFPSRLADQAEMFTNVKSKIGGYAGTLLFTSRAVF